MYDVLIIGCGVTGAAAAYALSKYNLKICVVEKENDVSCGASKANSGIVHSGYDPKPGSLMAKLNVRGAGLVKEICGKLDVPYKQTGSLTLAFGEGDDATVKELYERGAANGVKELKIISGEEARAMEPNLSPAVTSALHAPAAGIVSPWELALAMAETAVKNGAELKLNTCVESIEKRTEGQINVSIEKKSVWRVATSSGVFEARFVVNAAGANSGDIHCMAAAETFAIKHSRGQYDLLDKNEGNRVKTVIFQCPGPQGKGTLVAPTVHGNLLVGPDAIDVPGEDTSTTSDGIAAMREVARKSVPGVDLRQTIRDFAGVRASADTGDFVIAFAAENFLDAAGICSPGLTAAPAIGEYAAELLKGAGLALNRKENFDDSRKRLRFKELPPEERTALVKKNPAYGRVVCRCETVTEGEILDTLNTPIPPVSVGGVKRRCNPGMGRCQGGFCAPRIVELLAEARGVSPEEIPQENEGSWILSGRTKEGRANV